MWRLSFIQLVACTILVSLSTVSAELPPAKMTSTTKPSSQIEGMKMLEKPKPGSQPSQPAALPPVVKAPPLVPQFAEYLHPGILVFLNGAWQGSDHLLNLSNTIGVYVQILKPEEETLEIGNQELQKQVEAIFGDASIKPQTMAPVGKPPLPAFEVEIFVYPIERGYAASVSGRLFESVVLDRFKMDPNMAFQAITWEKQSLIVSPKEKFKEQLQRTVQEIAQTFVNRFQVYERLKNSSTY